MTNRFGEPWAYSSGDNSPSDEWLAIHDSLRSLILYDNMNENELRDPKRLFARIAACVNACAGLSDEQLAMIPKLFAALESTKTKPLDEAFGPLIDWTYPTPCITRHVASADESRFIAAAEKVSARDAARYRWLRSKYAAGEETYLAEHITSESQLDEMIDSLITPAHTGVAATPIGAITLHQREVIVCDHNGMRAVTQ